MKIAIIGGGIFGITCAIKLAPENQVTVFEKNNDILKSASDTHQCRIHRGYHYPRSDKTVQEVLKSESSFINEFSDAVMKTTENFYCVSKNDSLVNADEYIDFCNRNSLEFEKTNLELVDENSIQLCLKVRENLYDYEKLKKNCWFKLKNLGVMVNLNNQASDEIFDEFDFVIICTYANINSLLTKFPKKQRDFQFEICEKVFFQLPDEFKNKSVIVMDGPFMSIDPVGGKDIFIIGDVVNTVHERYVGKMPKFDSKFLSLLDKGIIKNPTITNKELFLKSASNFFPSVSKAKYVGSSFTIKTVLPNVDSSDERPTIIEKINDKIITVFSGKIPTCIDAANQINELVKNTK